MPVSFDTSAAYGATLLTNASGVELSIVMLGLAAPVGAGTGGPGLIEGARGAGAASWGTVGGRGAGGTATFGPTGTWSGGGDGERGDAMAWMGWAGFGGATQRSGAV
jgi:hypothetical protein